MGLKEKKQIKELPSPIVRFLKSQHFVIVTTVDKEGFPYSSCKGIVKIEKNKIYLLDLYRQNTYINLKRNRKVNITAVDEDTFEGYTIKGYGKITRIKSSDRDILNIWSRKIVKRISHRALMHIRKDKSSLYHPEVYLPSPQYIIVIEPQKIVNLVPQFIQK